MLKESECLDCNNFSEIKFFCFDCPRLMCNQCELNVHNNVSHDIIKLQSNHQLLWNNEDIILDLFKDKSFGKTIFQEINRTIEKSDDHDKDANNAGDWQCTQCTVYNSYGNNKCSMCHYFRMPAAQSGLMRIKEMEYNKKLDQLFDKLSVLESGLSQCAETQFEHVARQYLNDPVSSDDTEFGQWFRDKYLMGRDLSVINEAVEKEGHNASEDILAQACAELIKQKNQMLIQYLPPTIAVKELEQGMALIQLKDVNKDNIVPEETHVKEITNEELWQVIIQDQDYTESQMRMIMTEMWLPSLEKVELLRIFVRNKEFGDYLKSAIPSESVTLTDLREALITYMTIKDAMDYLRKECNLCCDEFPMPNMQSFLTCHHEMCKACFKSWVEETVERKYPIKWGCPNCTDEMYRSIDRNLYTGPLRKFLLDNKSPEKIIKIFDEKLLNEKLMDSPFFHWCSNDECVYGFEADGIKGKFACRSCKAEMCLDCNRKWSEKHENITCQEYELLMLKDDPNLANILKDIGIECPKCGMRYALAAGGCLHFDCKACGVMFCGGCYTEFTDKCTLEGCIIGTGFHGHHPRNCLYYLRDNSPEELEKMLVASDYPKLKDKPETNCPFVITDKASMKEVNCNAEVYSTSGLCKDHYTEYLVQFMNRLSIDPADYVGSNDLNLMLFQGVKPRLEKAANEDENAFVARLKTEVKKLPLYIPKGLDIAKAEVEAVADVKAEVEAVADVKAEVVAPVA